MMLNPFGVDAVQRNLTRIEARIAIVDQPAYERSESSKIGITICGELLIVARDCFCSTRPAVQYRLGSFEDTSPIRLFADTPRHIIRGVENQTNRQALRT